MSKTAPRLLFYVQHLLGIGHLMRAATIVRAFCDDGYEVTMVSGGEAVPGVDIGEARLVQLPSARATDVYFKVLVDSDGEVIDDQWRERRSRMLLDLLDTTRPDVIVTELFPFGRRQLRHELLPFLAHARELNPRPKVICSVRDILVEPTKPGRSEQMIAWFDAYYDRLLVHGDPNLISFGETYSAANAVTDRLEYTGYVVDRGQKVLQGDAGSPDDPEVVVSAGGGRVGHTLLESAIEAQPLTRIAAYRWRVLVGRSVEQVLFDALREKAGPNTVVERARPDFTELLARSSLSISQGGYNTLMETLEAGVRAVVVPYSGGVETEQGVRVRLLAERSSLRWIAEQELDAVLLAKTVDEVMQSEVRLPRFATDGARESVRSVNRLLARDV